MASGAWSCPYDDNGLCNKVARRPCDPGMKGCVLAGRYAFFNDETKNERLRARQARDSAQTQSAQVRGEDENQEIS